MESDQKGWLISVFMGIMLIITLVIINFAEKENLRHHALETRKLDLIEKNCDLGND